MSNADYKALFGGLEINVLKLSELKSNDNDTLRIDSEFFSKQAVYTDNLIKSKTHFFLKPKEVVSGPFGSTLKSHSYLDEGIPFIRIENIRNGFFINKNNLVHISEVDNELLSNSQLFLDDIILSKVGNTIGYFARVDEEIQSCNISENNIGIKLQNYPTELRHYILTYLNCVFSQILVLRRRSGNAQPKLNVSDLNKIPIPVVSTVFQSEISKIINQTNSLNWKSIENYTSAENDFLTQLGLFNWKPLEQNTTVKKLSNSFAISGRLDAEYYQPKFDEVLQVIAKAKHKTLGSIATLKKSIEPGSDAYQTEGIPFIRVSDISKFGLSQPEIHLDRKEFDLTDLKPKKDTILLSKDGSVGIAYKVEQDLDVVTSSALLHLTITDKEVLPDYLTLVLNSKLTQMQAERDAGGSIIQHWRPDEIKQVLIPVLPMDTQKELTKQIKQSFKLRQESTKLIDVAKQAVEIAIEQDEKTAMKFIKDNT